MTPLGVSETDKTSDSEELKSKLRLISSDEDFVSAVEEVSEDATKDEFAETMTDELESKFESDVLKDVLDSLLIGLEFTSEDISFWLEEEDPGVIDASEMPEDEGEPVLPDK